MILQKYLKIRLQLEFWLLWYLKGTEVKFFEKNLFKKQGRT